MGNFQVSWSRFINEIKSSFEVNFGFSRLIIIIFFILTFTSVPVEESLAAEHSSELLRNALEELLNGGRVTDESGGHLETAGRNVTDGGLDLQTQNVKFC